LILVTFSSENATPGSIQPLYTLSEARSGVDWVDLMAAQGAFGTDFYDKSIYSVQSIVPTIVLVDLS